MLSYAILGSGNFYLCFGEVFTLKLVLNVGFLRYCLVQIMYMIVFIVSTCMYLSMI